ncbi:hypothetical protein CLAFUW4_10487 [Fulvia fulva]|uniref:Uncharacterized protein n=1 Tax=Passalora fulva TaxID=5499 RepID=A0A9Q8LEN9_PASFU|nr:uncharacterized protein CLAFUR5_05102 [Fulvia fulva]KAK4615897.1 hypothetical protein CLAFUR4_10490 [Fulvia fulva]KAK4617165.1 hypothetical protein CLAFUR0_10492 [Fulvia fulva]UJO16031.1 hypothetical protein CLAFUR5_05102 [Fulvia fulva]WPV19108.1 hypothetical protein CLAFUW4_10487 [Fulvia fulva]WPV34338.1 hypothetical protein CLAFUW7_10487 [Fulvia fulva]
MPSHHIFSIPQELQDMIFECAYSRSGPYRELAHMPSQRLDYATFRFIPRTHKIDSFLISKRWFLAAARAYVERQTVPMSIDSRSHLFNTRVLYAFATTVSAYPADLLRAKQGQLPRLRRMQFIPYVGNRPGPSEDGHLMTDEELRGLELFRGLRRWQNEFPGIAFEVKEGPPSESPWERMEALSMEEVERLMGLVQGEAKRAEAGRGQMLHYINSMLSGISWRKSKGNMRLYARSRVRTDGSSLIQKDSEEMLEDCLRFLMRAQSSLRRRWHMRVHQAIQWQIWLVYRLSGKRGSFALKAVMMVMWTVAIYKLVHDVRGWVGIVDRLMMLLAKIVVGMVVSRVSRMLIRRFSNDW